MIAEIFMRWRGKSSWQAQSGNLRVYVKIGALEQGKVSGPLIRG